MITSSSARRHTAHGIALPSGMARVLGPAAWSRTVPGPSPCKPAGVPSVQFGGMYLAQRKDYFADNGVQVTILPSGSGVDTLAAVASSQADIALENADTVGHANENDAGLLIEAAPRKDLVVTGDTKKHGLLWMTEGIRKNSSTQAAVCVTADESLIDTSVLSEIMKARARSGDASGAALQASTVA